MFNLLVVFAEIGNLKFNNLNLVYDIEATSLITEIGPFTVEPKIPRAKTYKIKDKFYGKVYPEMIELSIKDYESQMIILDSLIQPTVSTYSKKVQKITGIKPEMLKDKPTIDKIRAVLEKKMKNFKNCLMMAHNGNRFDNHLMLYEHLIDPTKISFLDTLSIIPIHLQDNKKLSNKSLEHIYFKLFKEKYPAHRAMSDVNALIRIMQKLKIKF